MNNKEYLEKKRLEVLKEIKPICDYFKIEYDYLININENTETLILNGQKIGCSCNSISAILDELIGYIFVKVYARNRYFTFSTQVINQIKKYWI